MTGSDSEGPARRGPLARLTNAAAGAIDVNSLVESVDVESVAERIDVDAVVERVDVNALVDRIDVNALIGRLDIDAVVQQIDMDALLGRLDVNALLDRVDPDRLLDRVGIDRLLQRADVNAVLDRVDVNTLLDRVDVNTLLDRVDPDRLLDRVNPDRLLDRVDFEAVLDRVDVAKVVDRAGVSDIVGETTGQVAGSVLDAARRQVASLDEIVGRIAHRVVGKDPRTMPEGPDLLVAGLQADEKGRGVITGHYAGPVSRFAAFLLDVGVIFGVYTLVASAVTFFVTGILGVSVPHDTTATEIAVLAYLTWAFMYLLVGLVISGGSVGKGVVGLKVVSKEGKPLTGRQALIRVLAYPLSFLCFGLGLLGIAFGSRRRAWHDRIAGTCVVYDWGERAALLPAPRTQWLSDRAARPEPG